MSIEVLVTYGSSRGGTSGIATLIAEALRGAGVKATVRDAAEVGSLDGFDAVVLGGALYATRWHRAAVWFARRHARALRKRPVWLFSSGPLDDSASEDAIEPTRQVAAIAERLGARGHRTFGGVLDPDTHGWLAGKMAAGGLAGDHRDAEAIRAWGREIAAELVEEAAVF